MSLKTRLHQNLFLSNALSWYMWLLHLHHSGVFLLYSLSFSMGGGRNVYYGIVKGYLCIFHLIFSVPLFWYSIALFCMLPRFVWTGIIGIEKSIHVSFDKRHARPLLWTTRLKSWSSSYNFANREIFTHFTLLPAELMKISHIAKMFLNFSSIDYGF